MERAVHAGEAGIDKIQPLTVSNQNPNLVLLRERGKPYDLLNSLFFVFERNLRLGGSL